MWLDDLATNARTRMTTAPEQRQVDATTLARAADVSRSTIHRALARGLTRPAADEPLAAWGQRCRAWLQEHRQKPGPRSLVQRDPEAERALHRWRLARARLAELRLQRERALVHTLDQCLAAAAARLIDLQHAFADVPAAIASALWPAMPGARPDEIEIVVEAQLRAAMERLQRGDSCTADRPRSDRVVVDHAGVQFEQSGAAGPLVRSAGR